MEVPTTQYGTAVSHFNSTKVQFGVTGVDSDNPYWHISIPLRYNLELMKNEKPFTCLPISIPLRYNLEVQVGTVGRFARLFQFH